MSIALRGPADVYLMDFINDTKKFMKTTEADADKVKEERAAVISAFQKVRAAYMAVGFIAENGFIEAGENFKKVLRKAMDDCHKKGVDAQSETITVFNFVYHKHKNFNHKEYR